MSNAHDRISYTRRIAQLQVYVENNATVPLTILNCDHYPIASVSPSGTRHQGNSNEALTIPIRSFDSVLYVCSPGYAIGLVDASTLGQTPLPLRLQPESPIKVHLQDADARPIAGAVIAPGYVNFPAWVATTPIDLPDFDLAKTDHQGNAFLRGATADQLWKIRVRRDNGVGITYRIPSSWDKHSPLILAWDDRRGRLKIRVTDQHGAPVQGARIEAKTNEEFQNPLLLKAPTIEISDVLGETDQNGELTASDLPLGVVDLTVSFRNQGIAVGATVRDVVIEHDQTTDRNIQLPPTARAILSVIDIDNALPMPGVCVYVDSDAANGVASDYAITNEDGLAEFQIPAGRISYTCNINTLPEGCIAVPRRQSIQLDSVDEQRIPPFPPIAIQQGRIIKGTITGLESAESLDGLLFASDETIETFWIGRIESDNQFTLVIPKNTPDESVRKFNARTWHRGSLTKEATTPWRLRFEKASHQSEK